MTFHNLDLFIRVTFMDDGTPAIGSIRLHANHEIVLTPKHRAALLEELKRLLDKAQTHDLVITKAVA